MSTTPGKIVLHDEKERNLATRLAIYLVYCGPGDKLTRVENTITVFKLPSLCVLMRLFTKCTRGVCKFYEKLILRVQIEIDFPYPVGRTASKTFFNYKLSKQITCFAFQMLS